METPNSSGSSRSTRRLSMRAFGASALSVVVMVGALLVAGPAGGSPAQTASDNTLPTSTTVAPDGSGTPTSATPTGAIAYINRSGQVLVGQGAASPRLIGTDAALDARGIGAVALSPDGASVAWITRQGSVVAQSVAGGELLTLANDAVVSAVGKSPVLAWNSTGDQVAYVAVGTRDMVRPRSTDSQISTEGAFPAPLPPTDTLGNVIRIVGIGGQDAGRIGDPSLRSMVGLTWSSATGLLVVQSEVPGTRRRYTLAVATPGGLEESPTQFSADDPVFSPDGRFLVGVGPSKGQQELLRVSTDTLERTTLATSARICSPAISPDATRVVFGAGPRCSAIELVASGGGPVVDVTPRNLPNDVTFAPGTFGWTAEGRYLTHPNCRRGVTGCKGPSLFLDPDTGRVVKGPDASTVVPALKAVAQEVAVDVEVTGPLRFSGSFALDPTQQAKLTDTTAADGRLKATLQSGDQQTSIEVQGREGSQFVTGNLTVVDPATGIDRTLFIIGKANVSGVQVFSISGIWMSTHEVPFASGKFTWAVRRR